MPKKPPKPDCLALLLCEGVIEDARSHNKTIVNTYNRIFSRHYPARHDRLAVFLSLTNGHGSYDLEIRIVRADAGSGQAPLLKMAGKVSFRNPLDVAEMTVNLRGMPIPAAGTYVIEVLIAGDVVRQRRFAAVLQTSRGGKS
jgi:hypothetical protein